MRILVFGYYCIYTGRCWDRLNKFGNAIDLKFSTNQRLSYRKFSQLYVYDGAHNNYGVLL